MYELLCSCDPLLKVGIPCCQVGVAVHHYLLIGGGVREGSVSRDGRWVGCSLTTNAPQHYQYLLHTTILTSQGDVTSSTHIRGSRVGLS